MTGPTRPAPPPAPWWWRTADMHEIRAHLDNPDNGLYGLDPIRFGVALSLLPINHPVLVAAALAVEVAHARHTGRTAHRDLSRDIAAGADWRQVAATHLSHDVLTARRAALPPGYPPCPIPGRPDRMTDTDPGAAA